MFRYLARYVDNLWINLFPPDHLVDNTHIALDNLHHFGRDILIHIVGDRDAVMTVFAEFHRSIYCLKETIGVDAGNDEISFVNRFGTFR